MGQVGTIVSKQFYDSRLGMPSNLVGIIGYGDSGSWKLDKN